MSERNEIANQIISACKGMNQSGLNQGTAGNISHRYEDGMLVTPSGIAYDQMEVDDIVFVSNDGVYEDGKVPSSEWRFHLAVLQARPDLNAVVHNHAIYSSSLSILNKEIPAIHYMIAAAGGNTIPCVPYATYGTPELSDYVVTGMIDRNAVIMQHHGMIAGGTTIGKALWLAEEVETLARMYMKLLQTGCEVPVLPDEEIKVVLERFKNYGLREKE